ncbi:MAG: Uma2 family endonuclease [Spirulina sp. SIO3F2]|nr:Uma2 family endonuclease [Spirulina sp. SIO3F2]
MTTQIVPTPPPEEVWTPTLPPTDLVFDDGVPLESNRHRIAMNLLIASIYEAFTPRTDFFAGGNMFVYYSLKQIKSRDFRGPDFFVVLDVDGTKERQGWVLWEEGGRYPDVIVELMSPSTAQIDLNAKKTLYEQVFRTKHYFVYDPFDPASLQGWELQPGHRFAPLQPNNQGWLWCDSLGLWLGTWQGKRLQEQAYWLRFYDPKGQLVLLPEERERQEKEQERQRAEQERQQAEQERQAKEDAIAQLNQQRQQQTAMAAKLRELGIDPDTLK